MKYKIPVLLFACLFAACSPDPVDTTGNISGTVYDAYQDGALLQGAVVSITSLNRNVTTGTDGHYYFADVEQGTYEVQVSKTNYVTDSKKITVRVGETSTLDFSMNRANSSLSVSPLSLDFGSTDTNLSLDIENTGKGVLEWQIAENTEWLICNPTSGSVQAGMKASVTVSVDRSSLAKGTYSNTLVVTSKDGGSKTVRFNMVVAVAGASLPQVSMLAVDGVTDVAATFSGSLVRIGTSRVTAHGFCWSTQHNPSLEQGEHQDMGSTDGPKQVYTYIASTLTPNTTYYVRAYATNAEGTVYSSNEERFTTEASSGRPLVETGAVSQLTASGAIVYGNILDLGHESGVTQHGHCWSSDSEEPTIAHNHTERGATKQTGSFISELTNLQPGTLYYVRAYAQNVYGIRYGDVVQFTTTTGEIKVSTNEVSNISHNEATSGGHITDLQGNTISECGVCWSTSANPTMANSHASGDIKGHDFSVRMTGLKEKTTYHVRAYVIAATGIPYYGQDIPFQTTREVHPAEVSETTVSGIGVNSATLRATVTNDGDGTISDAGFCYSTSPNPTTADNRKSCGATTASFSTTLIDLQEDTHYYVRAYVTNERGTNYGEQVDFQTLKITTPTLSVVTASNITFKSATFTAEVTSLGNCQLKRSGFCYATTQNPAIENWVLDCGTATTLRATTSTLASKTTYYVRAFAENEKGISYGEQLTITTKEDNDSNVNIDDYPDDKKW